MKLNIDLFFLAIIFYNALLLFGYYKFKDLDKIKWIMKEVPLYSQINLILSSIFTLMFFNSNLFYSFNLILISILYVSMIYLNHSKHYHFAFTAFLTYGFYQLASHTPLAFMEEIIIVSIGLIFIGLQYIQNNNENLKRLYQWTCAIISFLAFFYISVQSLLLSAESNSIIMLISYLILCVNYIYLTHITNRRLFAFLANIFIVVSIYQLYMSIPALTEYFEIFHFLLISGVFYMLYFKKQSYKWLINLKDSSLVVNGASYFVILFIAFISHEWLTTCILALLTAIILFLTYIKEKNTVTYINLWLAPMLVILSSLSLYEMMSIHNYDYILHFAITAVLMLVLSLVMKKWNIADISMFYIAQGLYVIVLLNIPLGYINHKALVIPVIMLLSLFMSYSLIKRLGKDAYWIPFTILSSLFYFSLLYPIEELFDNLLIANLFILAYPIMYLVVTRFIQEKLLPYFYWTSFAFAVISTVVAVFITIFNSDEIPALVMLIPLLVYAYHTIKGNTEVKLKINLYSALIYLPIVMLLITDDYFPAFHEKPYVLMFSGLAMIGLWLSVNNNWKRVMDWFIIPYLLVSNLLLISTSLDELILGNILLVVSVLLSIFIVHKRNWNYVLVLPLLQLVGLIYLFEDLYNFSALTMTFISAFVILALQYISRLISHKLNFKTYLDWYYIISFLLIVLTELYLFNETLLLSITPTILLAIILFTTMNRVKTKLTLNIIQTLTVGSLLNIYYKVLFEFYDEIWSHLILEFMILPFILAIIFLKKRVWDNEKVMTFLEWIVLSISAILIVYDAIVSSTTADTIIMGVIGLLGVILGMNTRVKSYFFIGTGIILITLYTQTRPLWKSMPWWIYLLVAGIVLITFASIHEWQKQNNNINVFKDKWQKLKSKFKNWK